MTGERCPKTVESDANRFEEFAALSVMSDVFKQSVEVARATIANCDALDQQHRAAVGGHVARYLEQVYPWMVKMSPVQQGMLNAALPSEKVFLDARKKKKSDQTVRPVPSLPQWKARFTNAEAMRVVMVRPRLASCPSFPSCLQGACGAR
jgi:hypothetical protein